MLKNSTNKNVHDGFMKQSKAYEILPSPAMLESYEEIAPGIVDKLITLVQKEQAHRHKLEENNLRYKSIAEKYCHIIDKLISSVVALLIILISFFALKINVIAGIVFCVLCYSFLFFKIKRKKNIDASKESAKIENKPVNAINDQKHVINPRTHRFKNKRKIITK